VEILATWQVGQLLWSMLWFGLFFMLIWLVISVFMDVFRSPDLGGWAKALWTLFILFVPCLGIFVYLLARGGTMADRKYLASYTDYSKLGYDPAPPTGGAASPDAAALADLRDRGVIDDAQFQALQQRRTDL
jgi:hypothetical protein